MIVDEVLAVGDSEFQQKCLGKIQAVGNEGRTVIFVSHNIGAIRQLCNTAILLSNGKLMFLGETETVISSYHEELKDFERSLDSDLHVDNPEMGIALRSVKIRNAKGVAVSVAEVGQPLIVDLSFSNSEVIQKLSSCGRC